MNISKKISQVFGVSNEEIASYIERTEVDNEFQKGLTQNKHIIIFGSSKQGKTAVTNKHLQEQSLVRINCVPESRPIDIYKSLLRQLNIEFQEEKSSQTTIGVGGKGGIKAKVKIPFLVDAEASGEASGNKSTTKTLKTKTIEYNLELPQDISEILKKVDFKKELS
ncbi:hypothetical protein [Flavobacterium sp. 1]|uniref:hypothetical protein n=1 Tax=Flavobacterium sp. 1 TaxID=2035200 RepID=UPI000C230C69|nr:hypothetical protein [Flavobacterium sp. 1]